MAAGGPTTDTAPQRRRAKSALFAIGCGWAGLAPHWLDPSLSLIPAITLAGLVELKDALHQPVAGGVLPLLVGVLSATVVSWLAIAWLLRFLQNHSTWWFVGYRLVFGVGLLLAASRLPAIAN